MARRLKLGIDVDGVVADFVTAFKVEAENVLHRTFPSTTTKWNFADWGITRPEWNQVWEHIGETPNWYYVSEQPFPGAARSIQYLTDNHTPFFITSRPETAGMPMQEQTAEQIAKISRISFPTVIVDKDKGPIAAALKLDAFIDDRIENLVAIEKAAPSTRIFLVSTTYSAGYVEPRTWTRVSSLSEFCDHIKEMAA